MREQESAARTSEAGAPSAAEATVREELLAVARDTLRHTRERSVRLAPATLELGADHYTDPERFDREKRLVFRRLPLVLAASCELRDPGCYKTLEVAGVPVLLVRGSDGLARAFLNVCTHRGAIIAEGRGEAARFVCPYHGWTFDRGGALVGIASRSTFGEVDVQAKCLRSFPVLERAGLIWVVLDPTSELEIEVFLAGYDRLLEQFGFESWHYVDSRVLPGANWKLAFDAHLEFYHLPVLHRATFGPGMGNKTLYYFRGPHQRLTRPTPDRSSSFPPAANLFAQAERPEHEWPTEALLLGEWILFPHVSINSFYDGGRGVLISQIFPGEHVDESFTVQTYLMAEPPDEAAREAAGRLCDFLAHVVGEEDLPTSYRQQRALRSGLLPTVCFGRNEAGLQHFHRWIERILATPDDQLCALFRSAADQ